MIQLVPGLLLLVPGFHPAQGLEEVQDPEPLSVESLWALLERDERTPEVLEDLRRELRRNRDAEARRVIDTLLNHWQVEHETLSREQYLARDGVLVPPEEVLPWEVEPLESSDEELLSLLTTAGPELRLRAAFTLMTRGVHRLEALRAILRELEEHDWIEDLAGAALGEALGIELSAARSEPEQLRWLGMLRKCHRSNREGAMDAVTELVERSGEVGEEACELILRTYGIVRWDTSEWSFHSLSPAEQLEEERVQDRLARVVRVLLDEGHPGTVPNSRDVERALLCSLRSEVARETAVPLLLEVLRETERLDVLRALCHLGVEDELVRRHYLQTLRGWKRWGRDIGQLPCWKKHDAETLAAFEEVAAIAYRPFDLAPRLVFGGLVDSDEYEVTRRFFEALEEGKDGSWAWLRGLGFRHEAPIAPQDSRIRQVNKLGLTISTRIARGEDPSAAVSALAAILQGGYDRDGACGYQDYYEWGFNHALALELRGPEFVEAALLVLESPWPFSTHVEYAWAMLAGAELSDEQAARVAALPSRSAGPAEWRGLSLLSADQQDGDPRFSDLRELPRLRQELYQGHLGWLENILAVTPLIARDEGYLLALLTRGNVGERRRALERIREYGLDSPTLRAAVSARERDCDWRLRELAGALLRERGW